MTSASGVSAASCFFSTVCVLLLQVLKPRSTRLMRLCPAFAPSVLLRRRAARSSHRSTACLAGEGTDRVALANRLSLLGRLQETSVSQQDFAAAAKYRDERNGLLASLNTSERLLQTDLDCLRTGTPAQRAAAVQRLGECGDGTLAELVAPSLHDSDSTVHAATEEALWSLWRCSGDKDADKLFAKAVSVLQVGAVTGADALRQSLALLNELVEKVRLSTRKGGLRVLPVALIVVPAVLGGVQQKGHRAVSSQ